MYTATKKNTLGNVGRTIIQRLQKVGLPVIECTYDVPLTGQYLRTDIVFAYTVLISRDTT